MPMPVQITFRHLDHSDAVEARIRELADVLVREFERITACRIIVEATHRHHHTGNNYHLRVEIAVPGQEIVVNRDPAEHHSHADIYVAIRDAFDAARRQLHDYAHRHRGNVKSHEAH